MIISPTFFFYINTTQKSIFEESSRHNNFFHLPEKNTHLKYETFSMFFTSPGGLHRRQLQQKVWKYLSIEFIFIALA
jgi:hypothetical protein